MKNWEEILVALITQGRVSLNKGELMAHALQIFQFVKDFKVTENKPSNEELELVRAWQPGDPGYKETVIVLKSEKSKP